MPQYVARNIRRQASYILGLQILLTAGAALFCWVSFNLETAYAVLLGGGVAVLGNLYVLVRGFIRGESQQLLWAFYRAEIGKWLLTILLFILIIKYVAVAFLFVLLGYLAAQLAFWFALLKKV